MSTKAPSTRLPSGQPGAGPNFPPYTTLMETPNNGWRGLMVSGYILFTMTTSTTRGHRLYENDIHQRFMGRGSLHDTHFCLAVFMSGL
jgi:hypothetical protein